MTLIIVILENEIYLRSKESKVFNCSISTTSVAVDLIDESKGALGSFDYIIICDTKSSSISTYTCINKRIGCIITTYAKHSRKASSSSFGSGILISSLESFVA